MKRSAMPLPSVGHQGGRRSDPQAFDLVLGIAGTCSWSHDRDAASIHTPPRARWLRSSDAPPGAPAPRPRSDWPTAMHECQRLPSWRVPRVLPIGSAFPGMVIVCVMSVPHIFMTLSVMIVPSCGLVSRVQRCAAQAGGSRASPVAHDGPPRARQQSATAPITCGSPRRREVSGMRGLCRAGPLMFFAPYATQARRASRLSRVRITERPENDAPILMEVVSTGTIVECHYSQSVRVDDGG